MAKEAEQGLGLARFLRSRPREVDQLSVDCGRARLCVDGTVEWEAGGVGCECRARCGVIRKVEELDGGRDCVDVGG